MAHSDPRFSMFVKHELRAYDWALIESIFDESTDYDEHMIEMVMERIKRQKRTYIFKVLLFPISCVFSLLFKGFSGAKNHINQQKQMIVFLKTPAKEMIGRYYNDSMHMRS